MFWKCFLILLLLIIILCLYTIDNQNKKKNISEIANRTSKNLTKHYKYHVPQFMLDIYHQNFNGTFCNGSEIVRSIIPETDSVEISSFRSKQVLNFNIPQLNKDELFVSAELKILPIIYNSDAKGIIKLSILDDISNTFLHVNKIHLQNINNSWITFNLTSPIYILFQNNGSKSIKIFVSIKSIFKDYMKFSLLSTNSNNEQNYPILLLSYTSSIKDSKLAKKSRIRRNAFDDYEEYTNILWDDNYRIRKKINRVKNTCRRKSLYVNFSEIEFNSWIVQPSGYEAFQCHGKCFYPIVEHLSPTKHAIIQALLHNVSPGKAPRSCCVPTKLTPISVLYIDNMGVLTYKYAYKDMVVEECGCR